MHLYKTKIFTILCLGIFILSCSKDEPEVINEEELITRVTLTVNKEGEAEKQVYAWNLDGEKETDIILENKKCALFICDKIYRYFVNPNPNKSHIKAANAGLKYGAAVGNGMNAARQLGNLPANICTPTYLADQAKALAKGKGKVTTSILSEAQMAKLKMGSLLSVSVGSDEPGKLIVIKYQGTKADVKPVVLVGKAVTFDSGGISLKPGGGMDEMKYDMCGGASVIGVVNALVETQMAINVVAIVPAVENMPNGNATKPGDVVTSMSGQTIEVLNTDAEGRLILCDALTYAERFKPDTVIDIATLTGAVIGALGKETAGLLSNDDELAEGLLSSGLRSGDRAWRLPLYEEYDALLKSNFADIANIGGPQAGTITAACFLARFTKKFKWAHLDVAGTAWVSGAQKGSTGRPVPILMDYLRSKAK